MILATTFLHTTLNHKHGMSCLITKDKMGTNNVVKCSAKKKGKDVHDFGQKVKGLVLGNHH